MRLKAALFAASSALIITMATTSHSVAQAPAGQSTAWPEIKSDPEITRDLVQEEKNRKFVIGFYTKLMINRDISGTDLMTEGYIQHSPRIPTGRTAFVEYAKPIFSQPSTVQIIRSATYGDLVYLHTRSKRGAEGGVVATIQIYRVTDGKISEHWDIVQPVPDKAVNNNGVF
jgi:predicted SnoaL-like aldol condensation-catalyzing enzyme